METIKCRLNNNPAFFWLMIFVICALLVYSLFNNFVFFAHLTAESFYVACIGALILIVGWMVLKVTLTLDFPGEQPRITAKGLFFKKVFSWPFEFDSGVSDPFSYSADTRIVRHLVIGRGKNQVSINASTIIYRDSEEGSNIGVVTFDSMTASGINKIYVMDIARKIESFAMKQSENSK